MTILAFIGAIVLAFVVLFALLWTLGVVQFGFYTEYADDDDDDDDEGGPDLKPVAA